jgi:tryptophan 2,3-dioxygenase
MKSQHQQNQSKKASSPLDSIPIPEPGSLTYNGYLKVNELILLQQCLSDPAHHDEPLFIIIHQTYELWFKLILHEMDAVFDLMKQGRARRATFYMKRIIAIMKLLVQQIHILETMTPRDFLGFRYALSPASGFGSSQFREIEFATGLRSGELMDRFKDEEAHARLLARYEAPSLGESFYAMLRAKGFDLPEGKPGMSEEEAEKLQDKRIREILRIYNDDEQYGDLLDLAESLVEFDEQMYFWRAHHMTVVERMIGSKRGTGGSDGVMYLQSTLTKRCFPELWRLRTYLQRPEGEEKCETAGKSAPDSGTQPTSGCPFHSSY